MKIKTLSIDIETYSAEDLKEVGVYKYAESDTFQILLFAYSINSGAVEIVDLANGEYIPEEVLKALLDPKVIKWAFNASFERVCLSYYLHIKEFLDPKQWRCSMVWCKYLGLPHSLEAAGAELKLDDQKMSEGKALIKKFSINGYAPNGSDWDTFKEYNKRDVEVEMKIQEALKSHPVPDSVWAEYAYSENINDHGVLVDVDLVEKALELDKTAKSIAMAKLHGLTKLENPNSNVQLKEWMKGQGYEMSTLGKQAVENALKDSKCPEKVKEVLEARKQTSRSSTKKYERMKKAVCLDGRVRGMFQFYGAHTGRFTSKIVQLQNLPRNHIELLDEARCDVKEKSWDELKEKHENIPDLLSQLIRTAFIAPQDSKFIVADFSSIEARVLAWLANETWKMRAFRDGKDIYCETASQMFGVPVEKNGVNGELRSKGKIAELACGYGGSTGALKAMGALDMGLKSSELKEIVYRWREANQKIVELWDDVERCCIQAVSLEAQINRNFLQFSKEGNALYITLPSGRRLSYRLPRIEFNDYKKTIVTYVDYRSDERVQMTGGRWVENIVQAIARDILMEAIQNLKSFKMVAHIHDEVVIETTTSMERIIELMTKTPTWAPRLLLNAEGFESQYYKKD